MTDDERQRILDGYKAAANPTEKMKRFAQEQGKFYDNQFDAAFNNERLQQGVQTGVKLSPENVARIVADEIGKGFSATLFTELFKDAKLFQGWTMSDALPVWYSLGNFALVVAVWTTYEDSSKATRIISLCRPLLQEHWRMSETAFEKLRAVIAETEASAFASFVRCKDGKDLMLFFARYVSRILGAPVPFSDSSLAEDQIMGINYLIDLPTEAAVCQFFIDTCGRTKGFLKKN